MNKLGVKLPNRTMCIISMVLLALTMLTYQVSPVWAGNSTISGSVIVSGVEFGYNETKYGNKGGGNRGINIYVKGGRRNQTYKFDPNPHGSKWYNKHQENFYKIAAEDLGNYYVSHDKFPRYEKRWVNIGDVKYRFMSPP